MGKKAALLLTEILFGLATCLLAGLTIAAWFAGVISPQSSWLIAMLGLGLTPMLILNLIVLIIWAIKRSLWTLVPLIAILVNVNYITSVLQFDLKDRMMVAQSPLKVATYNIHGQSFEEYDKTLASIMKYFHKQNVDIICIQEFCNNATWRGSDSVFKNWPYYTIHSKNVGMQLAIFSKYPITYSAYKSFAETANGATWVDIKLPNREIRLFNLHFQTTNINQSKDEISTFRNLGIEDPNGKEAFDVVMKRMSSNATYRAQQVEFIDAKIDSAMRDKAVIVCGDFNDTPASYAYNKISNGLEDSFKTAGSGYAYTFQPMYKLFRIDYIFYSPELSGIQYDSPLLHWSDHNPVIMELDISFNKPM